MPYLSETCDNNSEEEESSDSSSEEEGHGVSSGMPVYRDDNIIENLSMFCPSESCDSSSEEEEYAVSSRMPVYRDNDIIILDRLWEECLKSNEYKEDVANESPSEQDLSKTKQDNDDPKFGKIKTKDKVQEEDKEELKGVVDLPLEFEKDEDHFSQFEFSDEEFQADDQEYKRRLGKPKIDVILGMSHAEASLTTQYHSWFTGLLTKKTRRLKITNYTTSQLMAFPLMKKERNNVFIFNKKSRPISAWLIPTLDMLCEKCIIIKNAVVSPLCIVLTCNSEHSNDVLSIAESLGVHAKLKLVVSTIDTPFQELATKLGRGCDVLICTPRTMETLIHNNTISLHRLIVIAFDRANVLIHVYQKEVSFIQTIIETLNIKRDCKNIKAVRYIINSEIWDLALEELVYNVIKEPVICSNNYLEAAVCAKADMIFRFISSEYKVCYLENILRGLRNSPTVIVCEDDEVRILTKISALRSRTVLVADDRLNSIYHQDLLLTWTESENPVLICTDSNLNEMDLFTAHWLINFSLPVSKSTFIERFKVLKNQFIRSIQYPENRRKMLCTASIIIEKSKNTEQIPELYKLLTRIGFNLNEEDKNYAEEIIHNNELKKDFCHNLLKFGVCYDKQNCRLRHIMNSELDNTHFKNMRRFVELALIKVINPGHFLARMIASSTSIVLTKSKQYGCLPEYTLQLSLHCESLKTTRPFYTNNNLPQIDDIYGVKYEDTWRRAQVLDIQEERASLYIIDIGDYFTTNMEELIPLTDNLKRNATELVEVILADILPVDHDNSWPRNLTSFIRRRLIQMNQENNIYVAEVYMAMRNVLVVSDLFQVHQISKNDYAVSFALSELILLSKMITRTTYHARTLIELAEQANLNMPVAKDDDEELPPVVPKWANLNEEMVTGIYLGAIDLPLIYARLADSDTKLRQLEDDLTNQLKEAPQRAETTEVGTYCAVLSPTDRYSRGLIISSEKYNMPVEKGYIIVFLVDYGAIQILTPELVYALDPKYLNLLPFQAIECSLFGVDIDEELISESSNHLTSFCETVIYCKVVCIEDSMESHTPAHYKIGIMNEADPGKYVFLNYELIGKGYANWIAGEKQAMFSILESLDVLMGSVLDQDSSTEQQDLPAEELDQEIPCINAEELEVVGNIFELLGFQIPSESEDKNKVIIKEIFPNNEDPDIAEQKIKVSDIDASKTEGSDIAEQKRKESDIDASKTDGSDIAEQKRKESDIDVSKTEGSDIAEQKRKESDIDASKTDGSDIAEQKRKESDIDVSKTEGSDIPEEKRKESDIDVSKTEGSDIAEQKRKESDIDALKTEGSDIAEQKRKESDIDVSKTVGSDIAEQNRKESDIDVSKTEGSDIAEQKRKESDIDASKTDGSDIAEQKRKESDIDASKTDGSDIAEQKTKESDIDVSKTEGSDITEQKRKESDIDASKTDGSDIAEQKTKESDIDVSKTEGSDIAVQKRKESDIDASKTDGSDIAEQKRKESDIDESKTEASDIAEQKRKESDIDVSKTEGSDIAEQKTKEPEADVQRKKITEHDGKRTFKMCQLVRVIDLHTPKVLWSQSSSHVWIRVEITDVKSYTLHITIDCLYFYTDNKGTIDIRLFAPIDEDDTHVRKTGMFVEIKLRKLLHGLCWPRLQCLESHNTCIVADPEKLVDEKDKGWQDIDKIDDITVENWPQCCEVTRESYPTDEHPESSDSDDII